MTIWYGNQAVAKVEAIIGRKVDGIERRVIMCEAFADTIYKDSKKIDTFGVGQTGEWIEKGFLAALQHHIARVKNRLPEYDFYPGFLQEELVQSEYRGDLGLSPRAMKLTRERKFVLASYEFLDHDEYRSGPQQIKDRILAVSLALHLHGLKLK